MALTAPFTGTIADVLGRKRVIVVAMFALVIPTIMVGFSTSLSAMIFWRAVQGLVLPPIFAVMVAYIGDELPQHEATTVAGIYSSGSSLGGSVACSWAFLPIWSPGARASWRSRRSPLLARSLLRSFCRTSANLCAPKAWFPLENRCWRICATSTDRDLCGRIWCPVQFHHDLHLRQFLSGGPPFNLSASWLGAIFVVYVLGALLTPWTGWAVARFGRRRFTVRVIAIWVIGIALTLAPSLPLIIAGLAISSTCGLICQAISTGYVTVTAKAGRSSAVGLYVTSFYVGGSFGAPLGGLAWHLGGWPGVRRTCYGHARDRVGHRDLCLDTTRARSN